MTTPTVRTVALSAGSFRVLEWEGSDRSAIFLHGLTGVAEVWGPTVDALGDGRPHSFALEQRGHGHSPKPTFGYKIGNYERDLVEAIEALKLDRPHLVGHSMGARVSMFAAARHPELFRSVTIVDIGPERWKANWVDSVAAFDRLPPSWPSVEAAVGRAGQIRPGSSIDAALAATGSAAAPLRAIAEARLRVNPDGSASWLASTDALKQTVIAHRSRGFWPEWSRVSAPAMLVRGELSDELRVATSSRMRAMRPDVRFEELAGVGHNIPLIAPTSLAHVLRDFWGKLG